MNNKSRHIRCARVVIAVLFLLFNAANASLATIKRGFLRCLFGASMLLILQPAQASLIGLTQSFPDISTDALLVDYTVSGDYGSLIVEGTWFESDSLLADSPTYSSFTYDATGSGGVDFDAQNPGGSGFETLTYSSGTYLMTLCVDANTGILTDASNCGGSIANLFEITGGITAAGILDPDTVLLTGSIDEFGFGSVGSLDQMDWTSTNFTGALAGAFGSLAGGNIFMNAGDIDTGSFNGSDMTNAFTASGVIADTFSIPLPGAAWLFGSGLVALLGIRRKNHAQ